MTNCSDGKCGTSKTSSSRTGDACPAKSSPIRSTGSRPSASVWPVIAGNILEPPVPGRISPPVNRRSASYDPRHPPRPPGHGPSLPGVRGDRPSQAAGYGGVRGLQGPEEPSVCRPALRERGHARSDLRDLRRPGADRRSGRLLRLPARSLSDVRLPVHVPLGCL